MSGGRIGSKPFFGVWLFVCSLIPNSFLEAQPMVPLDREAGDAVQPMATMPQVIADGSIQLRLEASRLILRVAEPVELRLIVLAPAGTRVTMPKLADSLGPFQLISSSLISELPDAENAELRRWVLTTQLESIESGDLVVPSLRVGYRIDNPSTTPAGEMTIQSQPFVLKVTSLLGDNQDARAFRDLKPLIETPQATPVDGGDVWWLVGSLLIIVFVVAAFFRWWRRRPPEAIQSALREIETVSALVASNEITVDEACAMLTKVLRRFVEQRFGFPATSMSRTELTEALGQRSFAPATVEQVGQFLSEADAVRFAGDTQTVAPDRAAADRQASAEYVSGFIDVVGGIIQQLHHEPFSDRSLSSDPGR